MNEQPKFQVDNFFFSRKEDGSVILQYWDQLGEGFLRDHPIPTMEITLTAEEWASLVAHVSAHGNNPTSYRITRAFHDGRLK